MTTRFAFTACTIATLALAGACSDAYNLLGAKLSTQDEPASQASGVSPASATLAWNALTRTLIIRNVPNQQAALRAFAYTNFAEHEALVALDSLVPGAKVDARGSQSLVRIALSHAAAIVLADIFPADASLIEQQLDTIVAAANGPHPVTSNASMIPAVDLVDRYARAAEVGRIIGSAVVARAHQDGFDLVWTGTVPVGYGKWASAFNPARAPLLPRLGEARTFFMTRGDQFRPAAPPAPGTPEFQAALQEVRQFSDTRTDEQKRIAAFWAMATGPLAAGYWNGVADSLVARDRLNESAAAHVLAVTNMATWDANVACHDTKYTYWLARPTTMDPQVTTSIGLPNHPSYPSNHGCLSGAAAAMLGTYFPGDAAALRAQADEAALSRVYAGLHYRFDGETGLTLGRKAAALAVARDAVLHGRFDLK